MNSASLTVGAVIANAARATPRQVAIDLDGTTYTFAELDAAGTSVAAQLIGAGVRPGDAVVALAPTTFQLMAHFVGCARAGAVLIPTNPALPPVTLSEIAETVNPVIALVPPGVVDNLPTSLDRRWFDHTMATAASFDLPTVAPNDPHIAYLTSGSTGTPKAVVVSHRASVLRSHPGAQLEQRGPALCPWPLFHMAGWTISLQQWHARAPTVYVGGTDAPTLSEAFREHAIERFNAVPALWTRLAEYLGDAASAAFPDLRFADTGTSPTSPELLDTIGRLAPNAQVRVFYGSSEAGNVASLGHDEVAVKPGSCGLPSVLTEIAIGDHDELLIRGPLLFDEYLGAPEATAAALRDGWYHTGDTARLDDDGYLSITGRLGNVIRTGGESVSPDVVEAALRAHSGVIDVAVFGVPDATWGEVVAAAIVANVELDLDSIRNHVGPDGSAPLARHEVPRRLMLVQEIPRTAATNQVDRNALRSLAAHDEPDSSDA